MSDSDRTAEIRLRAVVEASPSGLLMVDAVGRIVLANREIERMFGYAREELLGQSIEMLVPERYRGRHPQFRERFFADPQARASGGGRELYGVRKDKSEFPVEIGLTPMDSGEGLLVLSSIVDISARKRAEEERARLEEQLRHAQKLEAIGTLAGGVAHDFNNLLGAIIGCAELARETARSEESRRDLDELLLAAERGRQLVRRILTFSRRAERTREVLRLEPLVAETIQLLRATLPAGIDIQTRAAWDLPAVLADPTSIHQVLMNLATNAVHAMPEGGELAIELAPVQIGEGAQGVPDLRPGTYSRITVRDRGCGIDPTHVDRVFEPFFTTKPPGRGSGLGLAMVRGIMREHEGTVVLQSRLEQGTVVECYFPAVHDCETERSPAQPVMARGRGERILYIDDEEMLVRVGKRRLQSLGYDVRAEVSAAAALERLLPGAPPFDLVVTDYSMPRITGIDLAHQLRRLAPDVPIILLTGFIEEIPADLLTSVGIAKVILKPATWHMLAEEVRAVLDEAVQRRSARG